MNIFPILAIVSRLLVTSTDANLHSVKDLRCDVAKLSAKAIDNETSAFRRYTVALKYVKSGAENYSASNSSAAHCYWSTFLASRLARLPNDPDDSIVKAPFIIRARNASDVFAALQMQYLSYGDQRPANMPQLPRDLDDAFNAAKRGEFKFARRLLEQANLRSPMLHRIPFLLALLDIAEDSNQRASCRFLQLLALPPEYVSPDIVVFSEEQIVAVQWLNMKAPGMR